MKTVLQIPRVPLPRIPQQTMVLVVRAAHGLITLYFLTCLVTIYYAGITNQMNLWVYLAVASLMLEGIILLINHGDCPFGAVHRKFGDQKAFFELFLPQPLAKKAVPVLGVIAVIGVLLLFA